MAIRQITIIGTGLIGGSLGLALRKKKFAGRIVGCDREAIAGAGARLRGAIDDGIGRSGRRGARKPGGGAGDSGAGDCRSDSSASGPSLPREGSAHRCWEHENGGRGARGESVWEECGEAVSRGASDGGERNEWSGLMRMPICFTRRFGSCTPLPGQNLNEGLFARVCGMD